MQKRYRKLGGIVIGAFVAGWPSFPISAREAAQPSHVELGQAWQNAENFLFNQAYKAFRNANDAPARQRELGIAATLLNLQPRTRSHLEAAKKSLQKLIDGSNSDEVAITATYLLARMALFYEDSPQVEKARQYYRKLLEHHAGNAVAEHSAAQLVYVDLYEPGPAAERSRRFAELETLGPLLKTSSGRLNYHLNMGNAYIDFSGPRAKAIEHFLAADAEGMTRWQIESATWIAIGELARAEGKDALAMTYYQKFLKKYQRDNRAYTIGRFLKLLQSKAENKPIVHP
ncbi:MAG TPA: hypothetical protein VNQ90_12270 [Chthoniobacteraceae bacterium]|nr:hypothetical protein [Chthoniobacteraceae bacterium]